MAFFTTLNDVSGTPLSEFYLLPISSSPSCSWCSCCCCLSCCCCWVGIAVDVWVGVGVSVVVWVGIAVDAWGGVGVGVALGAAVFLLLLLLLLLLFLLVLMLLLFEATSRELSWRQKCEHVKSYFSKKSFSDISGGKTSKKRVRSIQRGWDGLPKLAPGTCSIKKKA